MGLREDPYSARSRVLARNLSGESRHLNVERWYQPPKSQTYGFAQLWIRLYASSRDGQLMCTINDSCFPGELRGSAAPLRLEESTLFRSSKGTIYDKYTREAF